MSLSNKSKYMSDRVADALKAAALIALLSVVILAIEGPRFSVGGHPDDANTAGIAAVAVTGTGTDTATSDYFPGRFPTPGGEPESQPATF